MDTGVASSDPIEEALPAYCEDALSHVICDPAVNFDTWWEYSGSNAAYPCGGRLREPQWEPQ